MGNKKERTRVQRLSRNLKARPIPNSGGIDGGTYDAQIQQSIPSGVGWAIEEKPNAQSVMKKTGLRYWRKLESQAGSERPALVCGDLVILSLADFVDLISQEQV